MRYSYHQKLQTLQTLKMIILSLVLFESCVVSQQPELEPINGGSTTSFGSAGSIVNSGGSESGSESGGINTNGGSQSGSNAGGNAGEALAGNAGIDAGEPAGELPDQPAGELSDQPAGELPDQPAGELPDQPAGEQDIEMGGGLMVIDADRDGIDDSEDNCLDAFNPEQSDIDGDGVGDLCELDTDQDGVPDTWDPEPQDPNWPGRALPDTVYAHTNSALYAFDVKEITLTYVANFSFDFGFGHQITDIAIDRAGVLWAISFDRLWLCHPRIGSCRDKGPLPENRQFNGLTFIPGGIFMENRDVLIAIETSGNWLRFLEGPNGLETIDLGGYPIELSSGDAFSIENVGTYAAVRRPGVASDIIVEVNPLNPSEINDIAILEGYNRVYGVAGWQGELFAFDESGAMLRVDLTSGEVSVVTAQPQTWWGAGVSSVIYSRPSVVIPPP